jgi:hypothetical protein
VVLEQLSNGVRHLGLAVRLARARRLRSRIQRLGGLDVGADHPGREGEARRRRQSHHDEHVGWADAWTFFE